MNNLMAGKELHPAMGAQSKCLRTSFQRLLRIGFGLLLALIVIEIAGRAVHYLPSPPPEAYVKLTNAVGPLPEPNSHNIYRSPEGEYSVRLDFNAFGFRDTQIDFDEGNNGVKRHLLVLGDSYTAAWQVPIEQRWTEQLARLRPDWTTLNLGMPNWGTDQEYLTLLNYPVKKAPDVTLLMFFAANDVSDNSRLLLTGVAPNHPYFAVQDKAVSGFQSLREVAWHYNNPFDQPVLLPFPSNVRAWLHLNSVVYYALSQFWQILHAEKASPPSTATAETTELPTEMNVFQIEDTEPWQTAWSVTEAILLQMKATAAQRGSRFVIVMVPYYVTIQASLTPDYVRANAALLDLAKPYRRLAEFAKVNDIPLLDLTDGFAQFYQTDSQHRDLFFKTDKHFTPLGNCVAAVLIGRWLDPSVGAGQCQ